MNAPIFTLGRKPVFDAFRGVLVAPLVVLSLAVVLALVTRKPGWITVAGVGISVLGTRLWAHRLLRLGPDRAEDPLPSPTHPQRPGEIGVQFNFEYSRIAHQRALDNWRSYWGVWITVSGSVLGVFPLILELLFR